MKRSISIDRILRNEFPKKFYVHFSLSFAMPDQQPGARFSYRKLRIVPNLRFPKFIKALRTSEIAFLEALRKWRYMLDIGYYDQSTSLVLGLLIV